MDAQQESLIRRYLLVWRPRPKEKPIPDLLLGKPLASDEQREQKIGPLAGIPIFGLDALGSAAYGPEAALTVLLPLGVAGLAYIGPITGAIVVLLAIVYFSYRQTIEAYPSGGGSYTVASQNLGTLPGLLAGAALLIDYVLVAGVGISAGVGALISAFPRLQPHTLVLCLGMLTILSVINLRGVRDTGLVFIVPTYLFVGCLGGALALGVWKAFTASGAPVPVVPPAAIATAATTGGVWLTLHAFSSGCTAMTGVEAVSNGVVAFREPRTGSARLTLTLIIAILMLMLGSIGYVSRAYHIGATAPGQSGYQSVLSQIVGAVAGRETFYYITMTSILLVLSFQANTAFADFPRVCHAIAQNDYLPRAFANRGRRLVYSHGIYVLIGLTAFLLIIFRGVTDHLIPLFAVGAFLAFTLSQAGMVFHWKRTGGRHARKSMLVNGLGALATGTAVIVVLISKFREGAWITLVLIPGILLTMKAVRSHYERVDKEVRLERGIASENVRPPLMVVPIDEWNRITHKALRFALSLSRDVIAVHVMHSEQSNDFPQKWKEFIAAPAIQSGGHVPELAIIRSPYRYVITPIVNYVFELERKHEDRLVAVVIPNLVERRWYQRFLHNQRGELLSALLLLNGNHRTIVINVPWYLSE
jgi:amino acid transporter